MRISILLLVKQRSDLQAISAPDGDVFLLGFVAKLRWVHSVFLNDSVAMIAINAAGAHLPSSRVALRHPSS